MKLYAQSRTGKTFTIDVADYRDVKAIHQSFMQAGAHREDIEGLTVGLAPFGVTAAASFERSAKLPVVPEVSGWDEEPSPRSESIIVGSNNLDWREVYIQLGAPDQRLGMVPAYLEGNCGQVSQATAPPFPHTVRIEYRRTWHRVANRRYADGGGVKLTEGAVYGMTKSEIEQVSAELGVAIGGLSAKVSTLFRSEVVITDRVEREVAWIPPVAKQGERIQCTLWQLVDSVHFLDASNGQPLTWKGRYDLGAGVGFPAFFPNPVGEHRTETTEMKAQRF